jgi:beta-lactamase regulating signal transducer with metallopeptidase domain
MVDILIKTTAILTLAFLIAAAMRRASAASRHVVWMAALVAVVMVPVVAMWAPPLPIRLPSPAAAPDVSVSQSARIARETIAASVMPNSTTPVMPVSLTPTDPVRIISGIWTGGSALLLLFHAWGAFRARRMSRDATTVDDARILTRAADLAARLHVRRPVRVLTVSDNRMPVTWGAIRPALFLPAAASSWSDRRLDAVLIHELAHVARFDSVAQSIARAVVAAMWPNPLVWMAARRARLEREKACDDLVLSFGARPSSYATDLLALLRSLGAPAAPHAGVGMARRTQIEQRLRSILSADVDRRRRSAISVFVAAAILAAAIPLAAAHPVMFLPHPITVQEPPLPKPALMRTSSVIPEMQAPARPAAPANFSGTWVPKEPERLRQLFAVGLADVPADVRLTIVQTGEALTIRRERTASGPDAGRPGLTPPLEPETVHRLDAPNVRWDGDRFVVTSQTRLQLPMQTTFSRQGADLIIATSAVNAAGHRVEFSVSYVRVPQSLPSAQASTADAEQQALSHPRPAGAELLNEFGGLENIAGTSERRCVEVQNLARSGEFAARFPIVPAPPYRLNRDGRLVAGSDLARTAWWSPQYVPSDLTPWPLEIRAVRLDRSAAPGGWTINEWIRTFNGQTPDKIRYTYSGQLRGVGRWMYIVTAGPNWGCFVYGTASPIS